MPGFGIEAHQYVDTSIGAAFRAKMAETPRQYWTFVFLSG
jgi:hypothetical protein